MLLLDLLVAAIATNGLVDAWRNGSIFADRQALLQAEQDSSDVDSWKYWRLELYLCAFCHSYHIGLLLFSSLLLVDCVPGGIILRALIYGLAAGRLSWLLNGILPRKLQYHRNPLQEPSNVRAQSTDGAITSYDGPSEAGTTPPESADL
jgi:hypothetical protein